MRNSRSKVLGFIALIIFLAIWLPTFGDLNTDGWARWIYNFQALIAGFVAAGAAGLTVFEMRRSTDKQLELLSKQLLQQQLPEVRKMGRCYEDLCNLLYYLGINYNFEKIFISSDGGDIGTLIDGINDLEELNSQFIKYKRGNYEEIPISKRQDIDREINRILYYLRNLKRLKANGFESENDQLPYYVATLEHVKGSMAKVIFDVLEWIDKEYPEIKSQRI